ncbi:transglycosylase domain-containing protein [Sphingosinicella sp.]|uniref:transglycosylase domain-containing protein n=1 Tax=Sphingosinicella sp. TaxID=1917971 RepID=UPI00403802E5
MLNAPPPDSGISSEIWDGLADPDRTRIAETMREQAAVEAKASELYYAEMDASGAGCPPWRTAPEHLREHYLKNALFELKPRYVGLADFGGGPPRIVVATIEGHRRRGGAVVARIRKITKYTAYSLFSLLAILVLWLAVTAPLNQSLQPIAAPSYRVVAADGQTIARRGAIRTEPVDVTRLPPYVGQAFIAIEDRRFFRHLGVDPWGMGRAVWRNFWAGRVTEGGSTISQQLAKTSFTGGERTMARKAQEALITIWLEAWLSKEEILSRYLSNVYFGNNVYGLRAAARYYFSVEPERLTLSQATMLAGLVNAPNRLAPDRNLAGAQARAALVLRAMTDVGFVTEAEARRATPARLRLAPRDSTPTGTYFADWVLTQLDESDREEYGDRRVDTTLERDLQRSAIAAMRDVDVGSHQAALVAMRLDGRVVAMLGGRDYGRSTFNRATQARRQPGSTFKLFVYLAALRAGLSPQDMIEDEPITSGEYRPRNYGNTYRGEITLAEAFATSSNVAAVRLARRVGIGNVIRAARDLGITAPMREDDPSIALGTANVSLLEMTAAYAAVAAGSYPVTPQGIITRPEDMGILERLFRPLVGSGRSGSGDSAFDPLRGMLLEAVRGGTGRAAQLPVETFGKTGTTQDSRDALFIGFAGDLVVGVWVGDDNNQPMQNVTGGGLPARLWRAFMLRAMRLNALEREAEE